MKSFLLFFIAACFLFTGKAQLTFIDSLKNKIHTSNTPEQRLSAILDFCSMWDCYSPDTLFVYTTSAHNLAVGLKDKRGELKSDFYRAAYLYQVSQLDSSLKIIDSAFTIYKKKYPYDDTYRKYYRLACNIYLRKEQYDKNLATDIELLKAAEQHKDTIGIALATMGIGNTNNKLQKLQEALNYYFTALQLLTNDNYKRKLSLLYNNIAIVYYKLGKKDSTFFYIKEGVDYSRQSNLTDYANALSLYGGMLAEFKEPQKAEPVFEQEIEVRKKIGDIYYLVMDMPQLGLFYIDNGEPQKAIDISLAALKMARQYKMDLTTIYQTLQRGYKALGDYKNANDIAEAMLALKDSVYEKNSNKAMAEMQAKYDVQKMETQVANQKLVLLKKNYLIYSSVLLLTFTLLLGYQIFRRYRQKQQYRLLQAIENEKQLSAQAINEAEENERKRIAADLHDSLGAQANALLYGAEQLQKMQSDQPLLNDLHYTAKDMLQSLRETVWAMKHAQVSANDIWLRIINFNKQLGGIFKNIKIITEGNIPQIHFPSPKALHIILIIQEAVNNAVRHSQANKIIVNSEVSSGWQIKVKDNGKGFEFYNNLSEGNGLINMQNRSRMAGLQIHFETMAGYGTELTLKIPVEQG